MQLLYTFKECVATDAAAAGLHHIPIGIPVSRRIGAAHHITVVPLNSIDDGDDDDDDDDGIGLICKWKKKQHCHQYNVEDERDEEAHWLLWNYLLKYSLRMGEWCFSFWVEAIIRIIR